MKHYFRSASSEEDLDGGIVFRSVGESVDEAGDLAIDVGPVCGGWAVEFRSVGDSGNVEEEVG